jgi:hypothetical protein
MENFSHDNFKQTLHLPTRDSRRDALTASAEFTHLHQARKACNLPTATYTGRQCYAPSVLVVWSRSVCCVMRMVILYVADQLASETHEKSSWPFSSSPLQRPTSTGEVAGRMCVWRVRMCAQRRASTKRTRRTDARVPMWLRWHHFQLRRTLCSSACCCVCRRVVLPSSLCLSFLPLHRRRDVAPRVGRRFARLLLRIPPLGHHRRRTLVRESTGSTARRTTNRRSCGGERGCSQAEITARTSRFGTRSWSRFGFRCTIRREPRT